MLSRQGHELHTAQDGPTGLARARVLQPDIVVLDIGLPGLSGYEVSAQLREAGCPALLVAVTGYGQEHDRNKALQSGFDAHLTKPVQLDELLRLFGQRG